jgi:hypothetical protein
MSLIHDGENGIEDRNDVTPTHEQEGTNPHGLADRGLAPSG